MEVVEMKQKYHLLSSSEIPDYTRNDEEDW